MPAKTSGPRPIHPFPARMAPEIALSACANLEPGAVVLDPMAGSGTVLRVAASTGHHSIGVDLDPLSVLMARVGTTGVSQASVEEWGDRVARRASQIRLKDSRLPWIDDDPETKAFVEYWFGRRQITELRKIAYCLRRVHGPLADVLRVALSRIVVTKEAGVSLARDTSHSRPHRVRDSSDVVVLDRFRQSYRWLARRLTDFALPGTSDVRLGDARQLDFVESHSIDAVVSSPPYLNAIDYLRGHKMALVWLGYSIPQIRAIRSSAVGTERAASRPLHWLDEAPSRTKQALARLQPRHRAMVHRYAGDMAGVFSEVRRVLRPGGQVVIVIGNSSLRGVFIPNDELLTVTAERAGLEFRDAKRRYLPANRRYLPPPAGTSALRSRMRSEVLLTFHG